MQRSQPTPKKHVAGVILKMHKPDRTRERVPEGEDKGEKVPLPGAWPQTLPKSGPGSGAWEKLGSRSNKSECAGEPETLLQLFWEGQLSGSPSNWAFIKHLQHLLQNVVT